MAAPKLDLPDAITALLFDLDGVLTKTAAVHDKAWKQMFDDFLKRRAEAGGEDFKPFDAGADYNEYVDGKPRYDGVRSFLGSRGIELPEGDPDDPPDGGNGLRARQPQERARPRTDRPRRGGALRGLGRLRQGRPRGRPAARRRLLQRQLPGGARSGRDRRPLRGADRRHRHRRKAPEGKARAGHLPGRRGSARGRARRRLRLRGRRLRGRGGRRRELRPRGRRRPGEPRRRPARARRRRRRRRPRRADPRRATGRS